MSSTQLEDYKQSWLILFESYRTKALGNFQTPVSNKIGIIFLKTSYKEISLVMRLIT